jgi:hypothetical protein
LPDARADNEIGVLLHLCLVHLSAPAKYDNWHGSPFFL